MRRKSKIKFVAILIILIISIVTVSFARYVIYKSIEINFNAPPVDAGELDFTIKNTENTYNVSSVDDKVTISSKINLNNKYNIDISTYYVWKDSSEIPNEDEYKEFNIENNEKEFTREESKVGIYYLWVKIKYTSEIGEQKEIIKTSKMISVMLGDIKIILDDDSEYLSGDVVAKINYLGEYKYNTKAGYGKTEDEAIANATSENANMITIKAEKTDVVYYIYAVAENSVGTKITNIFKIDNIDNIRPTINEVTPSFARARINISDNKSGIKEYDITEENIEPKNYKNTVNKDTKELEVYVNDLKPNTKYYLWVKDNAKNVISKEFKTLNLSYEANPSLNSWTSEKTTITFCDIGDAKIFYQLGDENTYTYNKQSGIEIYENKTVNYILQDGNSQIKGTINVNNIDKIAPSVEVSSDYNKLTIKATDSGSGIIGYFITDTEVNDITKVEFKSVPNMQSLDIGETKDYLGNDLIYNRKYYVYVKDKVGNISRGEVISKIDTEKPKIEIIDKSTTTNSMTVSVKASDEYSGLTGIYKYYIGTEEGVYNEIPVETLNTKYTYIELEHNKTYFIKVEVQDMAGQIGSVETSIKTNELLVNNENAEITFNNAYWSKNKQNITVKTTTSYKMKYQIVKENGNLEIENSYWSEPVKSGTVVSGLENGDTLYVKLYDGTNASTNWASYNVMNEMQINYPSLTDEQVSKMQISNFNILTYNVNKSEIEVASSHYNSNVVTYNYYMKNVNRDTYNLVMTSSTYDEKVVINQPQEHQIYSTICVQLIGDEIGTLTRSKNKTITIADESIDSNVFADLNRTYVDSEFFTAIVPEGFKVSNKTEENVISKGLVLSDRDDNEFVWVPVQNPIYNEKNDTLSVSKNYTPMVRYQKNSTSYFEKIYYSYSGTTATGNINDTSYRLGGVKDKEPAILTSNSKDKYTWNVEKPFGTSYDVDKSKYKDILGFQEPSEFGKYLNSEYTQMIHSVDTSGGFLVGRYETTVDELGKIGSKKGINTLNNKEWYYFYKEQNNRLYKNNAFYGSTVVKTSMITGSQYDAMLNFALQGEDKSKVTSTELSYGNKTGSIAVTGSYENDKISNIYDLMSNVYEETTESKNTTIRLARGGVYFPTVTGKSAATKTEMTPTDRSEFYGSRISLFLLDSNDNIPPSFKIEATPGINNIKIDIINTNPNKNIAKYYYSISSDGTKWEDEIESAYFSHTFENLKQSRVYYIKVRAIDEVGNMSDYTTQQVHTNSMNISNGDLYIRSVYGKNPNCTVLLALGPKYNNSSFKIKYKVLQSEKELENEESFNTNTWSTGNVVSNLSDTNIILAKITDSSGNEQDDYQVFYLDGYSEEFSEKYTETTKYVDANGEVAYIPAGFKVGISGWINLINRGLAIEDDDGNQFIWIPVQNVIKNSSNNINKNYTPMAINQLGKNSKFYEAIYYAISDKGELSTNSDYKIGKAVYREPSLVTINTNGNPIYTWDIENVLIKTSNRDTNPKFYKDALKYNSAEEYGKYINEEYYNMINSVEKYGGFYIARYETSVIQTSDKKTIAGSKSNKTPYKGVSWYELNYVQDGTRNEDNPYHNSKSVVANMIWNSQYSALLNYINRSEYSNLIIDKDIGYHKNILNTGKATQDVIFNIFDLVGNVIENTMSVYSNSSKVARGSYYNQKGNAVKYTNFDVGNISNIYGSRMSLYIVDEEDDTNPVITKREDGVDKDGNKRYIEPLAKANSIDVKVSAYDPDNKNGKTGSGIEKYVYSISGTTDENGNYTNYTDYISYGNTYTYKQLKQGTTYSIKVTVYDHSGKTSQLDLGHVSTTTYKIGTQDVYIDAIYGQDKKGTIYLEFADTFKEKDNYYIEYQVGIQGAEYNENGTWKSSSKNLQTGVQVDNLSVGDIVYARVTDGKNFLPIAEKTQDSDGTENIVDLGTSIYTFNITQLENYSKIYETRTEYTDLNKDKANVPAGFAINELHNEIKTGLVIKRMKDDDGTDLLDGDEFVWVPVKDAIYDEKRSSELADSDSSSNTYKPMARFQIDKETTDSKYYEGVLYNYGYNYKTGSYVKSVSNRLGITIEFREVSLVTGSKFQLGWKNINSGTTNDYLEKNYKTYAHFDSLTEFGNYMNEEYKKMVDSVAKYGGFWVGRYETSTSTKENVSSIRGKKPMCDNWYNMYYYQNSGKNTVNPYNKNNEVATTMIYGSQWDAMLNWILTGEEKDKVFKVMGNHEGAVANAGAFGSDCVNNIFDTCANVREITQEAYGTQYRIYRGGTYGLNGNTMACERAVASPDISSSIIGTRLTMYLK